jgi:NTE family protein
MAPVEINGSRYVDGGMHSPTNADVLVDEDLDVVIIVSPMSAEHGRGHRRVDWPVRRVVRGWLEREQRALERCGVEVVVIQPGAEDLVAMGLNSMATDRSQLVLRSAFMSTGDQLRREATSRPRPSRER